MAEDAASYRPAKPRRTSAIPTGKGERLKSDWDRVDRLTAEDIRAAIASDPDAAPELDESFWRNAVLYAPDRKAQLTLRLDADVVRWFQAGGKGYQTRMNDVLKTYVRAQAKRKRR